MKQLLLIFLVFLSMNMRVDAQCASNESEITFTAECVVGDCALTVYVTGANSSLFYLSESFAASEVSSGLERNFCVPSDECLLVYMYYDGFDIDYQIDYSFLLNGVVDTEGSLITYYENFNLNCPPGSICGDPIPISGDGSFTADSDDTWYSFTPSTTGLYHISTCASNQCDTKIWVYNSCPWSSVEGPPGTYAYNDNADCGLQADTDIALEAGYTYLIRIGDNLDNCLGPIQFTFNYVGLIIGCMDPLACNFSPLAQTEGECFYFPSSECSSPDLVMNADVLLSSMTLMDIQATPCDVEEGQVTGDGNRTVITFSVRIDNIGEADYYIGDPSNNPEMFETVNCHGHVHYAGYGDYRLMDMQGNIIPAGHKNGFCVMDLCGFGQYNCGQMGISAGCYDEYGAGTSGQWFDITDVPDGTYRGLVTVNPLLLPDALGRHEFNYENNTYVFCLEITSDGFGQRDFVLLGDCPTFYDCLGVENGLAQVDCEGVCDGPSIWGDVVSDEELSASDLSEYVSILAQQNVVVTSCNDLSANGSLTVYDLALASVCLGESESGGNSACNFPHNILTTSSPCGMAITDVNFAQGYVDIELKSTSHDVIAYQFTLNGIVISSVSNIADNGTLPCSVGFNPFTNSVYALADFGYHLENATNAQPVCRVYFSQVVSNTICITGITDIVNIHRSRTANYIYGECFDATAFSTNEILNIGDISVMPNPVQDKVTFTLSRFVSTPSELIIRDHVGKLINVVPVPTGSHTVDFDMTSMQSGVYTVSSQRNGELSNVIRLIKL
jgi:hypothetical protein